jgi:hypothetical protein
MSSVLAAAAGRCGDLAMDSPFLPPGNGGNPALAKTTDALELRGVMAGPLGRQYCIYDPKKKCGVWVGMDDKESPITIVADDADEGSVEIRLSDGRLMNLKMHESKTASGGVGASSMSVPAAIAGGSAGRPQRVATETQAAWNEELQRRLAENAARN